MLGYIQVYPHSRSHLHQTATQGNIGSWCEKMNPIQCDQKLPMTLSQPDSWTSPGHSKVLG